MKKDFQDSARPRLKTWLTVSANLQPHLLLLLNNFSESERAEVVIRLANKAVLNGATAESVAWDELFDVVAQAGTGTDLKFMLEYKLDKRRHAPLIEQLAAFNRRERAAALCSLSNAGAVLLSNLRCASARDRPVAAGSPSDLNAVTSSTTEDWGAQRKPVLPDPPPEHAPGTVRRMSLPSGFLPNANRDTDSQQQH